MSVIKRNTIRYNLLLIFILLLVSSVNGQITATDSTIIKEIPDNAEEIHSPKKAALYSTLLPGLGQAYNKKYWKIPIIYAGFGTIGYFIGWNNGYYNTMKVAYSDLTDGNPDTDSHLELLPPNWDLDDPSDYSEFKTALSKQQDYFRRNRDLLVIGMFAFYGLNIIDASVDAHLFDFDITEDLTFNWQPAMKSVDDQLVYGFNCSFNF